ncbi:MAG: hypothetical protein ABW139_16025 [Candidatus Thiodiazotropha sp. DIVDIV]
MNKSHKLTDDPQLSALYHSGRKEQPTEVTDQLILNEARKVTSRRRSRWIVPLSSAALLLLGVGLTLPLIELPYESSQEFEKPTLPIQDSYPEEDLYLKKAPAPAAQASAPALPKSLRERSTSADSSPATRRQALAPKMKSSPTTAPEGMSEAEVQSFDAKGVELTPDVWLNQIEVLIQSNQHQSAKHQLQQFRTRYPDYPLPDAVELWLIEN